MCGILGIFSTNQKAISDDQIAQLRKASLRMLHRGPDDNGEYLSFRQDVALFHRRLSIIDISHAGHQPMSNENRDVWITYNGEIYNYKEIQSDLMNKGHRFQSSSDTEVIIHGYEEYGESILEKLRGMFAFAIYDQKKRHLFIARDRVGIKPLYFRQKNGFFYFASSLHALIEAVNQKPELDFQNVYEYLYLGFVQAPNTILKGFFKLPPGHYMIIQPDHQQAKTVQYWEVDHGYQNEIPEDEDRLVERLNELIIDSIKSRLVSDVPVSVFLSGGLDSSLVAAIASKHYSGRLKSFSLGFKDDPQLNEPTEARATSKWLGTEHHEILIGKEEVQKFFPEFVQYQEEPSLNPIQMMIYFLSQLVNQTGTKVVLSGDGGDELFFGYTEWIRYLNFYERYYSKLIILPSWAKKFLYRSTHPFLPVKPRFDVLRQLAIQKKCDAVGIRQACLQIL